MTLRQVDRVILSSTLNTFKNYPSTSGSISVPSQSYTSGEYKKFTTTIALDRTNATFQVLQTFSFAPTKAYFGFMQESPDANFITQPRITLTADTLTVDLFVVNISPGTESVTPFTLAIEVRRFITPFE